MKIFIRRHGSVLVEKELNPPKEYILGRTDEADIQLTAQFISRRHARLFFENDRWYFQDLREGHDHYRKEPVPISDEKGIDLEGELELVTSEFLAGQKTGMFDPEQLPGSVGRSRKFKSLVALTVFITFTLLGVGGYYTYHQIHKPMGPETLFQFVRPKVVEFEMKRDEAVLEQIKKIANLKDEDFKESVGFCTGFIVDKNIVLTASHCVLGPSGLNPVESFTLRTSDGNRFVATRVLGFNVARDFLFLEVPGLEHYEKLEMADGYSIGEKVYTVGNVHGQGIAIREGITASKTRDEQDDSIEFLRFSAAASPGNSGGPLVNAYGEVVGLVFARSGWSENYNIATDVADLLIGMKTYADDLSVKTALIETRGLDFYSIQHFFEMFDLPFRAEWEQYPEKTRPLQEITIGIEVPRPLAGMEDAILTAMEGAVKEKYDQVAQSLEGEITPKEGEAKALPLEWTAHVSAETPLILPFPDYDSMEIAATEKNFMAEKRFIFYTPLDRWAYDYFRRDMAESNRYSYNPIRTQGVLTEAKPGGKPTETLTEISFVSDYWNTEEKKNLDTLAGYSRKLFARLVYEPQTDWEPLRHLEGENRNGMILGEKGLVVSFIENPFLKQGRLSAFTLNELPEPETSIMEDLAGRKWTKGVWKLFDIHEIEQHCLALPQGYACLLGGKRELPMGLGFTRKKKNDEKEFAQYMVRPGFWDVDALIDFIAKGNAKNLHGLEDVVLRREADETLTVQLKTAGITFHLKGNDIPKMIRIVPALYYNNGDPKWLAIAFTGYHPAEENSPLRFCGADIQWKNLLPHFDSASRHRQKPTLQPVPFTIKNFGVEAELMTFCQSVLSDVEPTIEVPNGKTGEKDYQFQDYLPKNYTYTFD